MTPRLMHGDCLEKMAEIPAGSVDLVLADPPYGMAFQSNRVEDSKKKAKIAGDERPFIWFLHQAYRVTKDGGALVCFTDWKNQEVWRMAIECAGFAIKSHCVWDRGAHGMGDLKASFAPKHDVFWFATKGAFQFSGKRLPSVLQALRPSRDSTPHPTAKPPALMLDLCRSLCPPGGHVCDPFLGSGATGEAAVQGGFQFTGVELDQGYFNFAKQRIMSVLTPDTPTKDPFA